MSVECVCFWYGNVHMNVKFLSSFGAEDIYALTNISFFHKVIMLVIKQCHYSSLVFSFSAFASFKSFEMYLDVFLIFPVRNTSHDINSVASCILIQ